MYSSISDNSVSAQDKLIENYYILNQIIQTVNVGTVIIYEKKILHINNHIRRISQNTYKKIECETQSLIAPQDWFRVVRAYVAVLKKYCDKSSVLFNIILPDGSNKFVRARFAPIRIFEKSGVLAMVYESENVNLKSVGLIHYSGWRSFVSDFPVLFDNGYDFMIILNRESKIIDISKKVYNILGIKRDDLINKHLNELLKIEPLVEISGSLISLKQSIYNTSTYQVKTHEIRIPLGDQKHVNLFLKIAPINIYDVNYGYGITAKVVSDEEYNSRIHPDKETIINSLSDLYQDVSDRLSAVSGFCSKMLNKNLTSDEHDMYLRYINLSCISLTKRLNSLDYLSDGYVGQSPVIKNKYFEVNALFSEVESFCCLYRIDYHKSDIKAMKIIQYNDSTVEIMSDRRVVRHLLLTSIVNIFNKLSSGFIKYSYKLISEDDKRSIVFVIKVSGVFSAGNAADSCSLFFEVNENLNTFDGLNQGMDVARIAHQVGAKLYLSQSTDDIVKIEIVLPLTMPAKIVKITHKPFDNVIIRDSVRPIINRQDESMSYNWFDKVILIAEDAQINFILLQRILLKTGAKVLWAKNGAECVEIFKSQPVINAVLMDMQMPVMDGYEATLAIHNINPSIPVIAQTAFTMADEKQRIVESGCVDFVYKPIDRNELLTKINTVII